MKNNIIFRCVLICGVRRKGIMNKQIKTVVTSAGKRSEEEKGSFRIGTCGLLRYLDVLFLKPS